MRLLYLINSIDAVGGAEKVACSLAIQLAQKYGHELHIAYVWSSEDVGLSEDKAVLLPLAQQLDAACIKHNWLGKQPMSHLRGNLKCFLKLRRLLSSFKPDIIHSHCFHPDLYSLLQPGAVPRIRTLHNEVTYTRWVEELVERFLAKRRFSATVLLCPSLKERWEQKYGTLTRASYLIPNPVSDVFFEDGQVRSSAPRPPYQLGIVGRLEKEKGHTYAIEALEVLAEELPIELHLAGGGSLYPKLRAIVDRLTHLKAHFLGSLSEGELVQLYRKLDLLIIPSLYEGFNLTAYESLAMGLPIVGTDVSGVCDILKACDREPIPIQDVPALRAAVKELLLDEQEYLRYAATAPKVVTHCRLEQVTEAHHQLYEELLHASI